MYEYLKYLQSTSEPLPFSIAAPLPCNILNANYKEQKHEMPEKEAEMIYVPTESSLTFTL